MVTPVVGLSAAAAAADADGAFETEGRLAAADVASMPLEELAGHMGAPCCCAAHAPVAGLSCMRGGKRSRGAPDKTSAALTCLPICHSLADMGHIYLEVTTADGKLYGAFEGAGADAGDSHGHAHEAPAAPKAAGAAGHSHEEHDGHTHRRQLRA